MANLFGFSIDEPNKNIPGSQVVSPVPPNNEDGSDYYLTSGFFGQYVDIEGVYRTEYDLIKRYREMALHPECDSAIEDIVNEAIVSDIYDSPIEVDLSNLQISDQLKDIIRQEFRRIKELMDFDKKSHEIFRNWYVDGRIYYHKVIDLKRPQDGIQEVRYIDAMKIKFVREVKRKPGTPNISPNILQNANPSAIDFPEIEEYFVYTQKTPGVGGSTGTASASGGQKGIKIAKDAITYVTSGLVDRNKQTVLSYLHKAIKALNQLRMLEDSLVIYRLSRAPERRIFYIDVGNLPKVKAEQYLKDVMNRYRNKLVYDANTGEVRDDRKFMSMMEDFWLPRREGGRGTEITTLPGGQNLGELTDIQYFQKKLYRALNVPESRITGDTGFNLGRSSEILRDELKFSKFVGRLRKRFANIFHDMLKTQLILKNIVTPEDWEYMSDHIQYDFLYDNHFADLKNNELLNERMQTAMGMDAYIGKYFSIEYVRRKVLQQTDEEIYEINQQIANEMAAGLIPPPIDPNTGLPIGQEPLPQEPQSSKKNSEQSLGKTPKDETPSGKEAKAPSGEEAPKAK